MTDRRNPEGLPFREMRRCLKVVFGPDAPPPDPVDAIARVLSFCSDDLAPLLARLADFAADPAERPQARNGARRVGNRLRELASILEAQDQASWLDASERVRGSAGWKGWRTTCKRIAATPASLSAMWVVADHLAAAGNELAACSDACAQALVQARATSAVKSLMAASLAWNEAVARPQR